jgi:hypothetical protein
MQIAARPDPDEYWRGHGVKWYPSCRTAKNNAGFLVHHLRPWHALAGFAVALANSSIATLAAVHPAPIVASRQEASKPIAGVCLRPSRGLPGPPALYLHDERPTQKGPDHH